MSKLAYYSHKVNLRSKRVAGADDVVSLDDSSVYTDDCQHQITKTSEPLKDFWWGTDETGDGWSLNTASQTETTKTMSESHQLVSKSSYDTSESKSAIPSEEAKAPKNWDAIFKGQSARQRSSSKGGPEGFPTNIAFVSVRKSNVTVVPKGGGSKGNDGLDFSQIFDGTAKGKVDKSRKAGGKKEYEVPKEGLDCSDFFGDEVSV